MSTERHGGRRGWRWVKRIVLGLLAVVVVAIAGALIFLHTDAGRGVVRTQVEARLNNAFVGGATIGKVEGSPFGDLVLRDIVINGPDRKPVITVKRAKLELGILPLVSNEARLSGVELEDVDVDLRRDANGELIVNHMTKPGPKSTWSIDIPDIKVRRAHVAYDTGSEVMNFDNIAIDGAAHMPYEKPLDANVSVKAIWREKRAPMFLETKLTNSPARTAVSSLLAKVGDIEVTGTNLEIVKSPPVPVGSPPPPSVFSGRITAKAPRAAVAQLFPSVDLPDDIAAEVVMKPLDGASWTNVDFVASIGDQTVRGLVNADITAKRALGLVSASSLDLAKLTRGKVAASGGGVVVFDVAQGEPGKLPVGHAMIHAAGDYQDFPHTGVTVSVSSSGERITAAVGAINPGMQASISGELKKLGDRVTLERAHVLASTTNPKAASGGKAPFRGALNVNLVGSGALMPRADLAVTGRITGSRLAVQDVSVQKLNLAIDARRLPSHPIGKAVLEADGVQRQNIYLRQLLVTAGNREDGRIAVALRTRPKQDPWLVEADALVTPGKITTIDLERHHVRVANKSDWVGNSGRIVISPSLVEVKDFKSASADGLLSLEGHLHRAGRQKGDLYAKLDADKFALENIDQAYRGILDARVDVQRINGLLQGTAEVKATGLALDPKVIAFDVNTKVDAHDGQLLVNADASSPRLGATKLDVHIHTPKDVTDVQAWKHLGRGAIHAGRLQLQGIDIARAAELAGMQGEYRGRVDGEIHLSAQTTGGTIAIRKLFAPQLKSLGGTVDVDLHVAQPSPDQLVPSLVARVKDIGDVQAFARFDMPDRIFDPAAWRSLGRDAFLGATVQANDIAFDPGMLDRLGITKQYARGKLSFVAELKQAFADARVSVAVRDLRGSPISQPMDVDMVAGIDAKATGATLDIRTREMLRTVNGSKVTETFRGPSIPIIEARADIPLTIAEIEHDPKAALGKAIRVTAKIPRVPATQLMAVFGRNEVTGGTIDGQIDVAGTVAAPTAKAKIVAAGLQVPPGAGNKPVKVVKQLALDATWDGKLAKLVLDGTQDQGMLRVDAQVAPGDLGKATVKLVAKQFDLAPVLVFAPGPAGGAAGRLDANLSVASLDPTTMRVLGEAHLNDGRVPIAPSVGTMRRAKIDVAISERDMRLSVDGQLGRGSIIAKGTLGMEGARPTGGEAAITLRRVSPIGVVEPQVDADVSVKLRREADAWVADMLVERGTIKVPSDRGEKLKPAGAPPDMVFMSGERITNRPMEKKPPSQPKLIANITLKSTFVESAEVRSIIKGKLTVTSDGVAVGIVGRIDADRGQLDLFGHRYDVERASIRFDGSTDPVLDVRITHDFPEVTTITEVRGRLSKPELVMTSNPATYSQGQLLGFLLGGEPDGEPGNARDRATAAGTSFVANKIGGYVKKALPIDLDVLRYESATSTSSAAVTVGTWLTRNLFIAYRRRLESRPDENTGEGEIQYWISRRVTIEGVVGDRNYNGVDLLWRRRY
ncbi:MAG TPA: translocation/assembly module TamB domain-containing protein [Kofleriaceae bacterium]|nr:translocation/assembly module TamB domain-containing protein [Kofleriaceae bacterium]